MKTAEEILFKRYNIDKLEHVALTGSKVVDFAIEFAKLHCIEQARVISKKAKTKSRKKSFKCSSGIEYDYIISVDKNSILNAYDLNNIK